MAPNRIGESGTGLLPINLILCWSVMLTLLNSVGCLIPALTLSCCSQLVMVGSTVGKTTKWCREVETSKPCSQLCGSYRIFDKSLKSYEILASSANIIFPVSSHIQQLVVLVATWNAILGTPVKGLHTSKPWSFGLYTIWVPARAM